MKTVIHTTTAPSAIGPYSQAIVANGFAFLSGQIPIDPATGQVVEGEINVQTHRVMQNLQALLEAAGSSLSRAVKTTVYLSDMADFGRMNEIYSTYFEKDPPARTTIQAARLPRDVRLEIDVVALV